MLDSTNSANTEDDKLKGDVTDLKHACVKNVRGKGVYPSFSLLLQLSSCASSPASEMKLFSYRSVWLVG